MSIRIYPLVKYKVDVKKNAKALGLDMIDYKKKYLLKKVKTKSPSTEPLGHSILSNKGDLYIIGNQIDTWLYIETLNDWWKTSPIISCKKITKGFSIETKNSFYVLEEA